MDDKATAQVSTYVTHICMGHTTLNFGGIYCELQNIYRFYPKFPMIKKLYDIACVKLCVDDVMLFT